MFKKFFLIFMTLAMVLGVSSRAIAGPITLDVKIDLQFWEEPLRYTTLRPEIRGNINIPDATLTMFIVKKGGMAGQSAVELNQPVRTIIGNKWYYEVKNTLSEGVEYTVTIKATYGTQTDIASEDLFVDITKPEAYFDVFPTSTSDPRQLLNGHFSEIADYYTLQMYMDGSPIPFDDDITFKNPTLWSYKSNPEKEDPPFSVGQHVFSMDFKDLAGNSNHVSRSFMVTLPVTPLQLDSLTLTPGDNFDPSAGSNNQQMQIAYAISGDAPDSVSLKIVAPDGTEVKNFSLVQPQGQFIWDGKYASMLVVPGRYTLNFVAKAAGHEDLQASRTFQVVYPSTNRPMIDGFNITPNPFNPNAGDAIITFKNTNIAEIRAEVRDINGGLVKVFDDYNDQDFVGGQMHQLVWNGLDSNGNKFNNGTYKFVMTARNSYGVSLVEQDIVISTIGASISTSNAHVGDIRFSPSSTFRPESDEVLTIKLDVKQDLDDFEVYAIRGTEEVKFWDEGGIDQENNYELEWDGKNENDDYVDAGTWRIEVRTTKDNTLLKALKMIDVSYDKPRITDLYVSKDKFDNEIGEVSNVLFRVDTDANVSIYVLQDGDEDETIEEDMEVRKNKWYAVEWDGGDYDYSDDVSIRLVAANLANTNLYDVKDKNIDIAGDKESAIRANVTNDYISPVAGYGGGKVEIGYELDQVADVKITISRGSSAGGAIVATVADVKNEQVGSHYVSWDGKGSNGSNLSDGVYTYKIVATKNSRTDTETGLFIVGNIGDIEGNGVSNNGSGSDVLVDGVKGGSTATCGAYRDVSSGNQYCAAIKWASDEGLFRGYSNGTFGPNVIINRVEALKVVMLATGLANSVYAGYDNLGFSDVPAGEWYVGYLRAARDSGVFSGDQGGKTARPGAEVNRVELLKFVFESLRAAEGYSYKNSCINKPYSDVSQSEWYSVYTCEEQYYGLLQVAHGASFYPAQGATRAEVANILYKLYQRNLIY